MSSIRKLSVGPNFPDGAVHFLIEKEVLYNRDEKRKTHVVTDIEVEETEEGKVFQVYIQNIPKNGEVVSKVLWKEVSYDMPHVVEYSINLD